MLWKRITALGLLMGGAVVSAVSAAQDAAWIEERVRRWQPTADEKRWEQIGWARDIREAIRLGKKHQRPVFLFTLDGKMDVGRC